MFLRESNRSTALKTLALRLRGAKTELEDAGEDVNGMAESTSQLQAKLKALTHGKVDIMLDPDTFKSTTQILREMSAAWEDMTDIERAAALELMGGKRQANILSSVIQNFETVEDVIETSMNSSGSAMEENAKWLDSIEGKTYQFTNALQTMWSNMIDSEMVKGFLDFGTEAIQLLDTLPGKAIALVSAFQLIGKFKGFSIQGIAKGLGDTIQNITNAQQTLQALSSVSPVTGALPTESINAYAQAVAGLTAKQQANLLASQNLTRQDIQTILQTNKCTEAEIREAMAHVQTKATKEQEVAASQQLLAAKTQEAIASYKAQASKLLEVGTTEAAISASEAQAAADFLEANASEGVTLAKVKEAVASGTITAATGQEIIAKLGLTGANKGLLASIQALMASNPAGWAMMAISVIIAAIPLVMSLADNIKTTEEQLTDLNQEWDTLSDKIKTVSNDFKSLKSSADEVIPRFSELAKGVDQFGNNISLTTSEYAEFWDLNNKLADMFPELNMGMDSNGNSMLALSYSADTLTASLEAMVEAEQEAANYEIANTMPDVLENISGTVSAYKDQISDLEKEKGKLQAVYDSIFSLEDETVTVSSSDQANALNERIKYLRDLGVEVTKEYAGTNGRDATFNLSYDFDTKEVTQNYENAMAGLSKEIENINTKISKKWSDLNPVVTAYVETNYQYQNLNDDMQEVAKAMIGNLDFGALSAQGYDTEEEIQTYIRDYVLNPIQNLTPVAQNAFSKLFKIDTSDKSVKEYIESIKNTAKTIADNSDFSYNDVLKNTGYDQIIEQYRKSAEQILDVLDDNVPKYYEKYEQGTKLHLMNFNKYNREIQDIKDNLYSLSPNDLMRSFDIVKKYGIKTWDDLVKALENKTFDIVLEYDAEQEGIQQLSTAIEESISATGLSSESIANLKARYQDLENYDPARLFEETANGIHLNISALRELEKAYEDQNKSDLDKKLDGLQEVYDDLSKDIAECGDASERALLYAQRNNVVAQINDTATLAAQYEGLTSAYNKWKQAQSGGNERDMYDSILSGKEEMDKEIASGWVDDSTRAYLELLSGQDLSTAPYEKVLDVYKQLNKEIGSSGFNVYDFFTKDKDGNSTTDGIYNFFDTILSKQKEVGENWVTIGKDGSYVFDFGVNGDKAIADMLGISEELVQIILRAAQDAGFEINLDSAYSQMANIRDEAEAINKRLKELGATDYTFNINSTNIEHVETQIEEAKSAIKNLKNEDGTLKVGISEEDYQNAQTLLATLIYQKQTLDESIILSVDTSSINDGAVKEEIQALLDYKAAFNDLEVKTALGVDTTEAQQKLDEAKTKLSELPDEHLTTLNIDLSKTPEEINADISNITKDALVTIGVNDDAIFEYKNGEYDTKGTVTWENNIDAVTKWMAENHTTSGTVEWGNNVDKVKTHFTATGSINWSGGLWVNGTAHSSGSAYSGGSWGAPKTETSLVGELGPEILVRNGRWQTIGENGAEFTQVKKGDIIFNHKQTEELLKNGYVTGRGKAYASGTALSDGNGPGRNTIKKTVLSSRFSSTSDSLSNAADSVSDAADKFREVFDWVEVRLEEIGKDISYSSARLENQVGYTDQNKVVDDIIDLNKKLYDNLIAGANKYYEYSNKLLSKVPAEYRQAAQDGTISIEEFVGEADEKTVEAIQEYREWVAKGDDAAQQAEETLTEISNLAKQAIDNIESDFENKTSLNDSQIAQLEAYNALLETDKGFESEKVYQAIIEANNKNISELKEQRDAMLAELNEQVNAGNIEKYSQNWYDAVNAISEVDTQIIELTTDTEDYQDAINELHWEHFDALMSQYEAIVDEAENLIDVLGTKDLVNKETAEWTDEGIASLGLYAQQMEVAEIQAKKYEEEIEYLNKNWQKLGYTEVEYIEKLEELKSGQYDAIKAYNDTKDAIVDLNKTRVDAIKKGIEKEIEAYEELINKKKEELDAEKDLHDFQKGVADQQKEIADIERKLAALSADNSASARAKRAQLEADLLKAQAELEETYYDRSISDQQDALDKELENFQNEKDKEIDGWEEYLENTNQVVSDSLSLIQANTDVVYQTLVSMGEEYGLSITNSLTSPWQTGELAIQSFSEKFGIAMSSTVEELQKVSEEYKKVMAEIEEYGNSVVEQADKNAQEYKNESTSTQQKETKSQEVAKTIKVGGQINAGSARIYDHMGDTSGEKQYYSSDPIYTVLGINGDWVQVRHKSLKSGTTGWFKKSDVKAYAKGTIGTKKDQWAIIDELGEELRLIPDGRGRLSYMRKGTGVVPADLTSNLMEWGKLDPTNMLEQNRPQIGISPSVINNTTEIHVDASVGELLHVEHIDGSNPAEISKIVDKAWDKRMKDLNAQIRRRTNR